MAALGALTIATTSLQLGPPVRTAARAAARDDGDRLAGREPAFATLQRAEQVTAQEQLVGAAVGKGSPPLALVGREIAGGWGANSAEVRNFGDGEANLARPLEPDHR